VVEEEILKDKYLKKEMQKLFTSLSNDVREYFENQELTQKDYDLKLKTRKMFGLPLINSLGEYEYHKRRISQLCQNSEEYEKSIVYLEYILNLK